MGPEQVAAHARERLGVEAQAVTLARAGAGRAPAVWAVMTEVGRFWVVARAGRVELFRDATPGAAYARCATAATAARRFLELHPVGTDVASAEDTAPAGDDGRSSACRACGADVIRRRPSRPRPPLCRRCAHAERERLRYQADAEYRARRLADAAARHRQDRGEPAPGDEPLDHRRV
jgi:hypothetical protein